MSEGDFATSDTREKCKWSNIYMRASLANDLVDLSRCNELFSISRETGRKLLRSILHVLLKAMEVTRHQHCPSTCTEID